MQLLLCCCLLLLLMCFLLFVFCCCSTTNSTSLCSATSTPCCGIRPFGCRGPPRQTKGEEPWRLRRAPPRAPLRGPRRRPPRAPKTKRGPPLPNEGLRLLSANDCGLLYTANKHLPLITAAAAASAVGARGLTLSAASGAALRAPLVSAMIKGDPPRGPPLAPLGKKRLQRPLRGRPGCRSSSTSSSSSSSSKSSSKKGWTRLRLVVVVHPTRQQLRLYLLHQRSNQRQHQQ